MSAGAAPPLGALLALGALAGAAPAQAAAPDGPADPASMERAPTESAASSPWSWELGGEARLRYEAYVADGWGAGPHPDRDYLWWRLLPSLELRHVDGLRVHAQLVAAIEVGDEAGTGPVDEDRADLLQGLLAAPLAGGRADLRAGRQLLVYGSERLVSPRYGPNVPRAFDAVVAGLRGGAWRADLLAARPVATELGGFDDEPDRDRALWGLYAARERRRERGLDLYYLGFEDERASYDQGAGEELRHTLGSRLFGRAGPWDWNLELFAQAGRFEGADVRAWSLATDTGHALSLGGRPARLGLKANLISGDDDPADGELGTFQAMFPKGQYFGEAGLLGPANLINVHPSLELELDRRWRLTLAAAWYWRESTADGLYDVAGNLVRPDGGSDARFIGTQLDLGLDYAPGPWVTLSLGASLFAAGEFVADTGTDDTTGFLGIELQLRPPAGP